jgi:hypothetical protein
LGALVPTGTAQNSDEAVSHFCRHRMPNMNTRYHYGLSHRFYPSFSLNPDSRAICLNRLPLRSQPPKASVPRKASGAQRKEWQREICCSHSALNPRGPFHAARHARWPDHQHDVDEWLDLFSLTGTCPRGGLRCGVIA